MSQASISLDPNFKTRVAQKAKQDGLTLSGVIKIFLKDYLDGFLMVGSRENQRKLTENRLTSAQEDQILKASKEAKIGVNTDSFDDMDDFLADLKKYRNEN